MQSLWLILLGFAPLFWIAKTEAQTSPVSKPMSLSGLQARVLIHPGQVQSFALEGVVCGVARQQKLLALQDKTGAALLELPGLDEAIRVGDRVTIKGTNCLLSMGRFGIEVATTVVDNDQLHPPDAQVWQRIFGIGFSARSPGMVQRGAGSALTLEYTGPGVPRQVVPVLLSRKATPGTALSKYEVGLDFASYNGDWTFLPDFAALSPVATGVATNFSRFYSVRAEHTALVFNGYLQIHEAGVYVFHLTSDDGSRLEVGRPANSCMVDIGVKRASPAIKTFEQALSERSGSAWIELKGEVAFAGANQGSLEMEIVERGNHWPVTIVEGSTLLSSNLLHRQIAVAGVCTFSGVGPNAKPARLIVPSAEQVKIYRPAGGDLAINSLPPGPLQDAAIIAVVQRCNQIDESGVTAWVNKFPEGNLRQNATAMLNHMRGGGRPIVLQNN